MSELLLTIQEAAAASGKSLQTIRRAIKACKIIAKKKKTPQGFNYMVTHESVIRCYKLDGDMFKKNHERSSLDRQKTSASKDITDFVTKDDLKGIQTHFEEVMEEYRSEKENFMRFMQAFQDKFMALENQLKVLEAPKQKKWYQFWR